MNTFPNGFLDNVDGMRWLGDIHGSLSADFAIDDALRNGMKVGFIGDLTDQSDGDTTEIENDSAHILRRAITLIRNGDAVLSPGNHCAKLYRYFVKLVDGRGEEKTIKTSHGLSKTIEEIMTSKDQDFLIDGLLEIIGDAPLWNRGGNYVFVHAGAVLGMFYEEPPRFSDAIRKKSGLFHRALYGQTDGTTNDAGFPLRRYDWVDQLQAGHVAVIGHDIRRQITTVDGVQGGKLIHIDTGAGKGGHLSWLDIKKTDLL